MCVWGVCGGGGGGWGVGGGESNMQKYVSGLVANTLSMLGKMSTDDIL